MRSDARDGVIGTLTELALRPLIGDRSPDGERGCSTTHFYACQFQHTMCTAPPGRVTHPPLGHGDVLLDLGRGDSLRHIHFHQLNVPFPFLPFPPRYEERSGRLSLAGEDGTPSRKHGSQG